MTWTVHFDGDYNRLQIKRTHETKEGGATSLKDIAAGLNQRGITTARGGTWSAKQVARVLARARN